MRKGLGKGLGSGYFNLAPMDSHIHSLSAKGVKTQTLNMMGLQDIKKMNEDVGRFAKSKELQPFVATTFTGYEQIRNIPNFGDYRPKGWKLVETYFVDSSGFGEESEPALTINEFLKKIKAGRGYAIIEAGQFQVYIGEFVRSKTLMAKGDWRYYEKTYADGDIWIQDDFQIELLDTDGNFEVAFNYVGTDNEGKLMTKSNIRSFEEYSDALDYVKKLQDNPQKAVNSAESLGYINLDAKWKKKKGTWEGEDVWETPDGNKRIQISWIQDRDGKNAFLYTAKEFPYQRALNPKWARKSRVIAQGRNYDKVKKKVKEYISR